MASQATHGQNALLKKWLRWHGIIRKQATKLVTDFYIFRTVIDIIAANPVARKPSHFHPWLRRLYRDSTLVRIRRFTGRDHREVSLVNLLRDILDNNATLSVKYYAALRHTSSDEKEAEKDFRDICEGKASKHVTKRMVRADISALTQATQRIKRWVDKRIAHHDTGESPGRKLKYGDVENALAIIERIVIKYGDLLKGGENFQLRPSIVYDWLAIFQAPWKPPIRAANH